MTGEPTGDERDAEAAGSVPRQTSAQSMAQPPGRPGVPAPGERLLPREDREALKQFLEKNLVGRVALDVWTREHSALVVPGREPCPSCEEVARAIRQIASLHAGLHVTLYDIDRHAERAAKADVQRPPTVVVRGPAGNAIHVTGMFSGALFASFVDGIVLAGAGAAPLHEHNERILTDLQADHTIEGYVAPYDGYSGMQLQLLMALGAVSPRLRVRIIEIAEFPALARQQGVAVVPAVAIDGQLQPGLWIEQDLLEWLRRVDAGEDEPVDREQAPSAPYQSLEEWQPPRSGAGGSDAGGSGAGGTSPGGLVLPGR